MESRSHGAGSYTCGVRVSTIWRLSATNCPHRAGPKGVPTLILLRNGKEAGRQAGLLSKGLRELAIRLNSQAVPRHSGASLPMGLTMMALGAVLVVLAARRYWVVNHSIEKGKVSADHGLVILVTVLVLSLAIAMILYMLFSTAGQPAASISSSVNFL